ncbi:dipicolinate synthase subunit DpsA [Desulfotomaculum copahuensis]|uniref:Dipicolinic acid synthetase subunit A n=1 Tax=Desulfotomaculum copahuensis TaxID=1838280 RepID=A0A1B7LHY1_9FIRM|nr:dipicolinate synthase subunit DpsA [Desulfotomaculum copahuensis]OAT85889.1 dipicolinic acid synthetase subunit A [Desulfotomaculum copahuensis]
MQPLLKGMTVAVLGGDAREAVLAGRLAALEAKLQVVGLPVEGPNITVCADPARALSGARAAVLPVPGINERGELYSAYPGRPLILTWDLLAVMPAGRPVFTGVARPQLKDMVNRANLHLVELMKMDEVAVLNAIPSAEGAIQLAMEKTSFTIHGCRALVLGYGRTGAVLAQKLQALGARVTVVARDPVQRARAFACGMESAGFAALTGLVRDAGLIFNTVPAMVLEETVLAAADREVLIIDLASAPGGTDFQAAGRLGVQAVLAPGLPGKVAPKTAGEILARVIARLLAEQLMRSPVTDAAEPASG